tara:strand:- start:21162 stop:23618 length:2457 start_codon:yes stop_codon:yes gene_type:complete
MNKFGLSDSVIDAANAVLNKKKVEDIPEAEKQKEWPFHSAVEDIPEAMEVHLKPHGTAGTHYKVHAVGKKLADHGGIKVGETLSDTQVDDAKESGIRVKHVKESVGGAIGSVIGGAAKTAGKVIGGTAKVTGKVAGGAAKATGKVAGAAARTTGKVAGSVAGGTAAATKGAAKGVAGGAVAAGKGILGGAKDTAKGTASGTVSTAKGTAQGGKELVKRTVAGIKEEDEVEEGAMKRMATQAQLGEPGMGLDTYKDITTARKKLSPAERDALNKKDDKLPAPTKEDVDLVDQLLELSDGDFNELLDESTDEQLDEFLGAMARGAGNLIKKGASAAVNRMSVQGRADAAEKKTQKLQDKTKAVQNKMAARKKLGQQKAAASLAKQKLKAIKNQAKTQRANMNKPEHASEEVEEEDNLTELSKKTLASYQAKASDARGHRALSTKKVDNRYAGVKKASDKLAKEEVEIEESVGLSTGVMSFLDDYEDIMEKKQMDPVGQADNDIDNDGDVDSSDSYIHNRRKAIKKAMKKSAVKEAHNDKEEPPFDGGKPIQKKRMDKFGNVIKTKNMAKHLAKIAMKTQANRKEWNKEDYDPLLEGAGDEKPNSAGNAASLATVYQDKAQKAAAAGNSEVAAKMAKVAKKFYNKSDHMGKREKEGRGSKAESFEPEIFWSDAQIEWFETDNEELEEARKGGGAKVGETERSGLRVTKSSKEEPEHIAMQLRKVISVGSGHGGVHFDNGGKQKVHGNVAQAALSRYNSAKPAEKEEMQKHMKHSHKALVHVAGGHDLSKSPAAKKDSGLSTKSDPTQMRRHGVQSTSGHYN